MTQSQVTLFNQGCAESKWNVSVSNSFIFALGFPLENLHEWISRMDQCGNVC